MDRLTVRYNALTAGEFIALWESVWGDGPTPEQTARAMASTLFRVSVYDGGRAVAMARMIGDLGLCCYIKDVVVRPEYQGRGIGRMLVQELLRYIRENAVLGTRVSVELAALPEKVPFYEKLGFSANEAQRLRLMLEVP
jgi:GNAT superfamily N-acetyltransferase